MTKSSSVFEGHAAITDAAERLLIAIKVDDIYRPEGVFLREVLASEIAEHVAIKEGGTEPGSGLLSDAAGALADAFDALRADWTDYLAEWPVTRIRREWRGFAEATRDILPRILDRIRRRDECLYPIAWQRGMMAPG